MSLTVSTEFKKYVVKLGEDESEAMFNELVAGMLDCESGKAKILSVKESTVEVLAIPEIEQQVPEVREEPKPLSVLPRDTKLLKYKGFMYIKCPQCGDIRGFCAKQEQEYYRCRNCGESMYFEEPLVKMYLSCECGKKYVYWTNMDDFVFDIPCLECSCPISVKYNSKKQIYETIR